MKIVLITFGYLKWHYGKAIKSIFSIWKDFLKFVANLFSLRNLFRNLLDPWKRMNDPYPKHFSFKGYLFVFIVNIITRIVGFIMRSFLLVIGALAYIISICLLPFILLVWLLLPLILVFLIGDGLYLIFT